GKESSVGREHLLPITGPLHCLQHGFEIPANQPLPCTSRFRQTHLLKHEQSCINVLLPRPAAIFSGTPDNELFRTRTPVRHLDSVRPVDRPVERREPTFLNLAAL